MTLRYAFRILSRWMSAAQYRCLLSSCLGEEKEFFQEKAIELANIIQNMPVIRQGSDIAYLRYFYRGCEWLIKEKDMADSGPFQGQMYGQSKITEREFGYISLPELLSIGAELDFHWKPKPIR